MYEGTPELHPATGPVSDAARAVDGTSAPQASTAGAAMRQARRETRHARMRFRGPHISCVPPSHARKDGVDGAYASISLRRASRSRSTAFGAAPRAPGFLHRNACTV